MGKDVAEALGYKDTINAIKSHIDIEGKKRWQITTPSGGQSAVIINESGLYSLVLSNNMQNDYENRKYQGISSVFKHKFMRFNRNVI